MAKSKQDEVRLGLYCSADGKTVVAVDRVNFNIFGMSKIGINLGLHCSEDGKTVVEVIGFSGGCSNFVMFNQLRSKKAKRFSVDHTRPMFCTFSCFARLFPARVMACRVELGEDEKQLRTVVLDGLYCSRDGDVVRVTRKVWNQGSKPAEFIVYRQVHPIYGELSSRPRYMFLARYPIRITECVVE